MKEYTKNFGEYVLAEPYKEEDYSFYVNVDTDKKSVAILSYIPPTEILYAFGDFKTVPLIKDLIEKHPRLNIQLLSEIEEKIQSRRKNEREYQEKVTSLSATKEISQTTKTFESGIYVQQGTMQIISADEGPIGTTGVGPCVAICAKGRTQKGKMMLGFAHMEARQNETAILGQLESKLELTGVPTKNIEIFLVGGWRSTEELQKRLLALTGVFNIREIRINLKEKGTEYSEKKNYIDVVVDQNGNVMWGENGEIFKVK